MDMKKNSKFKPRPMKDKGQCEFASLAKGTPPRCTKPATRKWGDGFFCDEHGKR